MALTIPAGAAGQPVAAIARDPSPSLPAVGSVWRTAVNGVVESSPFSTAAGSRLFVAVSLRYGVEDCDQHTLTGAGLDWALVGRVKYYTAQGIYLYTALATTPIVNQHVTVAFADSYLPGYYGPSGSLVVHALTGTDASLGLVRERGWAYTGDVSITGATTTAGSSLVSAFVTDTWGHLFITPDAELLGQNVAGGFMLTGLFATGPYPQPGDHLVAKYTSYPWFSMGLAVEVLPARAHAQLSALPVPGAYTGTQEVTLSCSAPGATIRFTTDGSAPTSTSPTYSSPLSITRLGTTVVKAFCSADGYPDSAVGTYAYDILCVPGGPCDDGDPCTHGDSCGAQGRCVATPITCVSDPCIARSCDGSPACHQVPAGAGTACDDGNRCTHDDACDGAGRCAGTPVTCHAVLPCEVVRCDGTPNCSVEAAPAGMACTTVDACGFACDGVSPHCQPAE